MKLDSLLIHGDRQPGAATPVAPPLISTTTWAKPSGDAFQVAATKPRHPEFYGRYGSPTHGHAERIIAALEGADAALLLASGMAAVSTTVLSLASAGDHVIFQRNHYAQTLYLARTLLPSLGIETTEVDETDPRNFAAATRKNTKLIVVETPTNPLMTIVDIKGVSAIARGRGALTLADNTFATPINQRPLSLGADVVIHSATKYFGGHSDLMAGVVIGSAELVQRVWRTSLCLGGTLGAFEAWLLVRGLRTLSLRVARQNASALAIARFLERHPAVARVHYPGLPSQPGFETARAQMSGFGGVLSFELRNSDRRELWFSRLSLFSRAASLGGIESLAVAPTDMLAETVSPEEFQRSGVSSNLIRLAIGIEDTQDLVNDLADALEATLSVP